MNAFSARTKHSTGAKGCNAAETLRYVMQEGPRNAHCNGNAIDNNGRMAQEGPGRCKMPTGNAKQETRHTKMWV